jgi:hypothetical protein
MIAPWSAHRCRHETFPHIPGGETKIGLALVIFRGMLAYAGQGRRRLLLNGLLFCSGDGTKLDPNTIRSLIKAACEYLQARLISARLSSAFVDLEEAPRIASLAYRRNRSASFMTVSCLGDTLVASLTTKHLPTWRGCLCKNAHSATRRDCRSGLSFLLGTRR